ncbi:MULTISPECIES: zonular occludens toxin domain-containing protein [Vibrio]|uniref:zonular occludens toxin domain-containing protein n=1 Tax=Vibrio TaxID=662 RepID=UPI00047083BF|nr:MULTISPECIES: zonular occludens toxin domain-containing protein [Vibrio]EGQ7813769.1 assembly protein [Vibrio parahaemolyticus]MDF5299437.1 zonular occludens toxin domain-containing protein [Vibrio parahaemolyticus]MDF5299447.1 zonular occludens toxin domain-containing protein [Vibrio parahaemolyticus]MDF5434449.1 zonular occludens toxin domain-containing protein [Vibrio parahaemolyticus]MDF5438873.1 zonular occludens toxin domain-containing protein [Vibrio parahaemolyticus]
MIYAIAGRPGGGKTYEAVAYHIIPAIKDGRKVITNITLNIDWFVKIFGEHVRDLIKIVDGRLTDFGSTSRPFSQIGDYSDEWRNEKGQGPLYVVDEAHMSLPSRGLPAAILEWFSIHRHYGVDIILLTQNIRKVHRDIKDMIEVTYRCTKNTAMGSSNSYTKKVQDGCNGEVVNTSIRSYKSEYFPFYKSHSQSNKHVQEAQAKDIRPFWKRWPVIGTALLLGVGLPINIMAWWPESEKAPEPVKQQNTNIEIPAGTPTAQGTAAPAKKKPKSDFGPLDGYDFFITGYAKQIALTTSLKSMGELNRDLTFYKIYVDVYDGTDKLFSFNHLDLVKIGYQFEVLSDCVYRVTWEDSERIFTCGQREKPTDILQQNIPVQI